MCSTCLFVAIISRHRIRDQLHELAYMRYLISFHSARAIFTMIADPDLIGVASIASLCYRVHNCWAVF
ncbi:hypothetical protein PFISCL1PPCAC_18987, partial [Pristionchus fissidentatus]